MMSSQVVLHFPTVTFVKKSKKRRSTDCPLDGSDGGSSITVHPILIDFGRLLKDANAEEVIPGIPNTDLLHASATLYGVSLSEVTDDIIYPTLCEKWSKTLVMLQNEAEVEEKMKKKMMKEKSTKRSETSEVGEVLPVKSLQERNKILKQTEEEDRFVNIFSDAESSDEEECDVDDDFISGINNFLQNVDARKLTREKCSKNLGEFDERSKDFPPISIGIENRLLGCTTFERSYEKPGERIIQLTLMAVRKKYRGHGIGHFMMKQLFDATVTGGSDVIVVNADNNAVNFFENEGFTDDVLLNSRYAHIGDVWFNCRRMCYIPSYTGGKVQPHEAGEILPDLNLREMELEVALWKEKSLQVYQSHSMIVRRMRQEILTLRARVSLQDDTISQLRADLEISKDVRLTNEQEHLRKRLTNLRQAVCDLEEKTSLDDEAVDCEESSSSAHDITSTSSNQQQDVVGSVPLFEDGICMNSDEERKEKKDDLECSTEERNEMEESSSRDHDLSHSRDTVKPSTSFVKTSFHDELAHLALNEIKHCFMSSMNSGENNFSGNAYGVTDVVDIVRADLPLGITSRFNESVESSHNSDIVANLYYCGTSSHFNDSGVFHRIISHGFRINDFAESDYGRGLHFSRHARAAAHFSPSGQIIVAKVCLGQTQTVTSKDPLRKAPPDGFDSILTQGRLSSMSDSSRSWCIGHSEYIVFKHDQALPIALIRYNLLY